MRSGVALRLQGTESCQKGVESPIMIVVGGAIDNERGERKERVRKVVTLPKERHVVVPVKVGK